jgi:hypothetical protein
MQTFAPVAFKVLRFGRFYVGTTGFSAVYQVC